MTTEDFNALRARSDELGPADLDDAVTVYEAILREEAGDVLATRGLALALIKLGELDRAEEIVQEALVLHPEDKTLLARADDIVRRRRWTAREASTGRSRKRSGVARVASTWIKAVYYDGSAQPERPGDETWVSDPGQRDAGGRRMYTAAGEPWGRPSWRVGEQVGMCFGGTQRVPLLVEIIAPPAFDPAFVQAADGAQDDDGERWPWVTRVRVLKAVDVDSAPTLEELGIATTSMQQRARLHTDAEIHGRLVEALDAAS
ncbi:MAG TPA: tetratricopeptide repeat protein [Baekduia sp.]